MKMSDRASRIGAGFRNEHLPTEMRGETAGIAPAFEISAARKSDV
jgi:hypothetical protein